VVAITSGAATPASGAEALATEAAAASGGDDDVAPAAVLEAAVEAVPDRTPVVREGEEQRPLFPQDHAAPLWPSARPLPAAGVREGGGDLWKLCASGATLSEICARLSRSVPEVASEIADGARDGKAVDVARLLGAERVEAMRAAARGAKGDVVAIRRRLPFPAALAEIRLALAAAP
jgi:hypothetical protein